MTKRQLSRLVLMPCQVRNYSLTPFSLRLGHTQGKTIINRFLRPSCRFATLKASFQIFAWGMRTHATYVAG